jgi:hypothetical protein
VRRVRLILGCASAVILAAGVLGSCGGDDDEEVAGIEPAAASSCEPVECGGSGEPQALIVSDLPMRGDSAERSKQQVEAIRLVLDQRDWRAGAHVSRFRRVTIYRRDRPLGPGHVQREREGVRPR